MGYDVLISDIDNDYQHAFKEYYGNQENQPETVHKKLKVLVRIINWSKEDKGYTDHTNKMVKISRSFDREVIYLRNSEIEDLIEFTKINKCSSKHTQLTNEYYTSFINRTP